MIKHKPVIFDPEVDQLCYEFDYNAVETNDLLDKVYGNVTIEDLRRIALWKLDRVIDVPESLLERLRSLAADEHLALESQHSRHAIDALVGCDGVGHPMASAFLKFIRPDIYPIIDVRAYRALTGRRLRYSQYTTQLYLDYAAQLREIADRLRKPLAEIDEQLYCFDKEKNGRIGA
jgi:thermostable 8-oxoguanine DNA glycosylase